MKISQKPLALVTCSAAMMALLQCSACSGSPRRSAIDDNAPMASELATETTSFGYLSHTQILHSRRDPDDPVPLGGRVHVKIRRSTPGRAEFDGITVHVMEGERVVLDRPGQKGSQPVICGENSWCNEQDFDIDTPVDGSLQIVIEDLRSRARKQATVSVKQ